MSEPCIRDLACPAQTHYDNCPWFPENVEKMFVSDKVFEDLQRILDEPEPRETRRLTELMNEQPQWLTPREERDITKLVALAHAPITLNTRTLALQMAYPLDRWQLIVDEVTRRINVAMRLKESREK